MADWAGGYSAEWAVAKVDPRTWDECGWLDGVLSVEADRSRDGDAPLLESGAMELDSSTFEEGWHRVVMTAEQGGRERVAMVTLLFERASARTDHGAPILRATGRSVLQPAADVKMAYGSYAPAGCDGAAFSAGLLRACTPAPVAVDGSFTLVDDLVFDIGCSYLEAAWKVLTAADWCMQVNGRGEIAIRKKPTEPALELNKANAGLLVPGVDDDLSLIDVPNRYYAVDDSETAVATNDDPSSALSYASRGRWVDVVDTSPTRVDGESLEMYARRKLAEASLVTRTFTYTREFWPDVAPYDIVRASLPSEGLEGDLRVVSQRLTCGRGVTVEEKAAMEVTA